MMRPIHRHAPSFSESAGLSTRVRPTVRRGFLSPQNPTIDYLVRPSKIPTDLGTGNLTATISGLKADVDLIAFDPSGNQIGGFAPKRGRQSESVTAFIVNDLINSPLLPDNVYRFRLVLKSNRPTRYRFSVTQSYLQFNQRADSNRSLNLWHDL
ncbi:MAG: hypothetical protein ACKO7W_16935 [Elainella sp.]